MSTQASVDQVVPSKGALFVQSAARSVIVAVFAKYFPDLAKEPSTALVIDFLVVFGVSLGMAWMSATATRRHALNAALSITEQAGTSSPGTTSPGAQP